MEALILSCGTGGGHDAASRAIQEELIKRGHKAVMINPYTLRSSKTADRINKTYISLVQKIPSGFGAVYKLGDLYRKFSFRSPVYHLNGKMIPYMDDYLKKNHFDVVIMPHLFPAEILTQMKNHNYNIPKTVFVATDYTCIPFTEETECDAYIIPSIELFSEFNDLGIPSSKIYPFGIPVSTKFNSNISKQLAREQLGLNKDDKYLLISGGSIGGGKLLKVIKSLYHCGENTAKFIVICGNNKKLYNKLSKKYNKDMIIIKSTDKIELYMKACDLYLSKAGGLSSTEAAVMGVTLIHLPSIPGCESKNANFFSKHKMCKRLSASKKDALEVFALLNNPSECEEIIENQHKYIPLNATQKICDFVIGLSS